jgi:hypothetical protein
MPRRPSCAREVVGGILQGHVGQGLRKSYRGILTKRVTFFGQETHVVADADEAIKECAGVVRTTAQMQAVGALVVRSNGEVDDGQAIVAPLSLGRTLDSCRQPPRIFADERASQRRHRLAKNLYLRIGAIRSTTRRLALRADIGLVAVATEPAGSRGRGRSR